MCTTDKKESFVARFYKEIYFKEEAGIMIANYRNRQDESVTVTGIMLPTAVGLEYRFIGEWVVHPKYGKQFKADFYEELVKDDTESIMQYLSSGLIRGIGKATAKKIVTYFGKDTLHILDNNIEELLKVKGISQKKLKDIQTSYVQNRQSRNVIMLLSKHGISARLGTKVYMKFKEQAIEVIQTKPYLLSMIKGISFQEADRLGVRSREYEESYARFKMAASYVLFQNESGAFPNKDGVKVSGSIGMERECFGRAMYQMLFIKYLSEQMILDYTIRMIKEGGLVYKCIDGVYLLFMPGLYRIEQETAKHIKRISDGNHKEIKDLDALIEKATEKHNIVLSPEQYKGVKEAFCQNLSLIVGPPGTGKTTTITIIKEVNRMIYGNKMVVFAPSGKAASRIRQTTNEYASTVHSGCGIDTEIINDVLEMEEYQFENSLVIVDEMSMLDARTSYQMFSCISETCRVVLCGDDEQLSSVGAGAVLRDLIDSGVIPVTVLATVYRQDSQKLLGNIMKIRKGETDIEYGNDFRLIQEENPKEIQRILIELYLEKVKQYGVENVMLLSPYRKHDAGVYMLNDSIQQIYNPCAGGLEMRGDANIFRIGDIVMHLKNDSDTGIANGDVGVVESIFKEDNEYAMSVRYFGYEEERRKTYSKDNMEEICLSYATTVHKAQGSEAKIVLLAYHSMHSMMLKRNVFYTAVTRASEEVIIVGQKDAIERAIQTEDKTKRYTSLKMQLRLAFGQSVPLSNVS